MLFGRYFVNKIKNVTRVSRGDGGRYHFVPNTPILRNGEKVMRISQSKEWLFRLSEKFVKRSFYPKKSRSYAHSMIILLDEFDSGNCKYSAFFTRISQHTYYATCHARHFKNIAEY